MRLKYCILLGPLKPQESNRTNNIVVVTTFLLAMAAVVGLIVGPMYWGFRAYTDSEVEEFKTQGILTDAYLTHKWKEDDFVTEVIDYNVSFYYHDPNLPKTENGSKFNAYAGEVRIYYKVWDEFKIVEDEFFKVYFIPREGGSPSFMLEKETIPAYMPQSDNNSWGKPLTIGSIVYLVLFAVFLKFWSKRIRNQHQYSRQAYSDMV